MFTMPSHREPTFVPVKGMVHSIIFTILMHLYLSNTNLNKNLFSMKITLNEKTITTPDGATLHDVIKQENMPLNNIALAVNNRLVLRDKWATTELHEGDTIVAIVAAYGG